MQVKLEETFNIPFVIVDPATSIPIDGTSVSLSIFEANSGTAESYAPTVVNRSIAGNYSATVAATTANGFAIATSYELWATAIFGTNTYTAPIASFIVMTSNIDDVPDAVWDYFKARVPTGITYNGDDTVNVITWDDSTVWTHVYTAGLLTSITVS